MVGLSAFGVGVGDCVGVGGCAANAGAATHPSTTIPVQIDFIMCDNLLVVSIEEGRKRGTTRDDSTVAEHAHQQRWRDPAAASFFDADVVPALSS